MKRVLSLLLCVSLMFSACSCKNDNVELESVSGITNDANEPVVNDEVSYADLSSPELLDYMESVVYDELVTSLNSEDYLVENVEAIYISKEYLEEVEYNSQSNIYFGFTLEEVNEMFEGERFVFTLDENGETTVESFEEYDDSYDRVLKNVATGAGLILMCVTVSAVTVSGAPAVSLIFAASAKTGTAMAVSSGVFSSVTAGVVKASETDDVSEIVKAMALEGSEGFKWGAVSGVIAGGVSEGVKYSKAMKALKGVELNGITKQQAAAMQMKSKYPADVIKQFTSTKQYDICKDAGLKAKMVNGKTALVRNIDLNYVDEATGKTNLQLMLKGNAPVDPATGLKYELRHIGQKTDSTLAILTKAEHMQDGNNTIWHEVGKASEVHVEGNNWSTQKSRFWKAMAKMLSKGA